MKLWLLWVLASTVAFGVGGRLGAAWSPSRDLIVVGYFALSASTILTGVLQWLLLRRHVGDTDLWVLASVGAVAAIGVIAFGVGMINRDIGWVLGVVVGWIVLGLLQWLILRQQVPSAGWWVLATMLGLFVAGPVVGFVSWATGAPVDSVVGEVLRWVAFGAAYGTITGVTLSLLLRQH